MPFLEMAIAIIDNWLNDPKRSYEHGLQLYMQYGDDPLVRALVSKGHQGSHYHFTRLTDALRTLKPKQQPAAPAVPGIKENADPLDHLPKLEDIHVPVKRWSVSDAQWEKLPDAIKNLYTRQSRLHAHSQMLFNQSRICQDQEQRRVLDRQIIIERNEINENWKTIKDFHEKGSVKEQLEKKLKPGIDSLSIADLVKQSKNIPSALSKKRTRLKKMADGPQKNKLINQIMELEVELQQVNKRLAEK